MEVPSAPAAAVMEVSACVSKVPVVVPAVGRMSDPPLTTPPWKPFAPDKVTVPAETLTVPLPVIGPEKLVSVPRLSAVEFSVIAPLPASEATVCEGLLKAAVPLTVRAISLFSEPAAPTVSAPLAPSTRVGVVREPLTINWPPVTCHFRR